MSDAPHNERRHYSPSATIYESNRAILIALAVIAIGLSCIALSLSVASVLVAESRYEQMDREVRLQRMETDELGAAVARAEIPTHREGDKP